MDERRQVLRELGDLGARRVMLKQNSPRSLTKPHHSPKPMKRLSPIFRKQNGCVHAWLKSPWLRPCWTTTTLSRALVGASGWNTPWLGLLRDHARPCGGTCASGDSGYRRPCRCDAPPFALLEVMTLLERQVPQTAGVAKHRSLVGPATLGAATRRNGQSRGGGPRAPSRRL